MENPSNFMSNVEEVGMTGQGAGHWWEGPLGKSVEFEAKTTVLVAEPASRSLKEDLDNFARIDERGELGGPGRRPRAANRSGRYGVVWRPSGGKVRRSLS